jgi:L,D-peptidoglycan transpeptidase YkuD (ErfK/YbiS/YcfS/YnhG family)
MIPALCTQLLVTLAADESSHRATVIAYERSEEGTWEKRLGPFQAVIGWKGITANKREGDCKTPSGTFPLLSVFGKEEYRTKEMPFQVVSEYLEGVDDARSQYYNQIVDRREVEKADWRSSEKMQEIGFLYDLGAFIGYNTPPEAGKGSCIFLHVYRSLDSGTGGCTAFSLEDTKAIIEWLRQDKNPHILQIPVQEAWRLPADLRSPTT